MCSLTSDYVKMMIMNQAYTDRFFYESWVNFIKTKPEKGEVIK